MARWTTICQSCWEEELPGDYFPDAMHVDDCAQCGQEAVLVAHVNPNRLVEAPPPPRLDEDYVVPLPYGDPHTHHRG